MTGPDATPLRLSPHGAQRRYQQRLSSDTAEATFVVLCWALLVATVATARHGGSLWMWSYFGVVAASWAYPKLGSAAPKAPRDRPKAAVAALGVPVAAIALTPWSAHGWYAAIGICVAGLATLGTTTTAMIRIWPSDSIAYGKPWSPVWHSPTERRRGFEQAAICAFKALRTICGDIEDDTQAKAVARAGAETGLSLDGDRLRGAPRRLVVAEAAASAFAARRAGCRSWWDHEGAPAAAS